ncbi:MAG TPA: DUF86 domain-containing protein [Terracidiphilus sp.]|nr:DUF86 domain-containing protein [Terracidiphilus sp.]
MTPHPLRVRDYLGHMLDAIERILQYTGGKSSAEFARSSLLQDAVARNFEIMGEAARKVLDAVPDATVLYPEIPFAAIYGMRNQLAHGYFAVDWDTVWNTIQRDLPLLRNALHS